MFFLFVFFSGWVSNFVVNDYHFVKDAYHLFRHFVEVYLFGLGSQLLQARCHKRLFVFGI